MKTIYYPAGNGYKKQEKEKFYELLRAIKKEAIEAKGHWEGAYLVITYLQPDGTIYKYTEDMDYGIPYSIEQEAAQTKRA